jgi:hypothetical protein
MRMINTRWFAALVPAVAGYGCALLCVHIAERYGSVLFMALPAFVSFLAAFFYCYRVHRSFGAAYGTAVLSLLALGGLILITALDGLICLLMALPLALLVGLAGAALGRLAGLAATRRFASVTPLILCVLLPCLVAFEDSSSEVAPLRAVTTSIPVRSSPQRVWEVVVSFPRIASPPDGIFRCGIACPIEAHIEGSGVGAIRHCTFTSGTFVEPVTAWRPGELLAFDVTSSPAPMEEFSLYDHVDAPHLHGHMQSRRGQFRIVPADGGVLLEGTTWYSHKMWPQWYWGPITDSIIHRIHARVLEHIQMTAEGGGGP